VRGRRPKRVEPGEHDLDPLPVTQATMISAKSFESESEAESWLERCRADEDEREAALEHALLVLNRALHAHRLAAWDPYAQEVDRTRAQQARLGYGSGEQVADGRWSAAYTVPRPRGGRRTLLGSQEELARIIGGRNPARASEDLALRARLDLDHGRPAQAALQLEAALRAFAAEEKDEKAGNEGVERVRRIADAALHGELDAEQEAALAEVLLELERTLRRRRHQPRGDE